MTDAETPGSCLEARADELDDMMVRRLLGVANPDAWRRLEVGLRAEGKTYPPDYITQDQLIERFDDAIVIDVRDDDAVGGAVRGALHVPASSFGFNAALGCVARVALARQRDATSKAFLVFHCMESLRRGPRCAGAVASALEALGDNALPGLEIRVLHGGADQWMRRFCTDPRYVQDFDPDYWGFACDDAVTDSHVVYNVKTHC